MQADREQTLFGHPTGLYTLFFAEMWERFSYYGMRALLVLYMIKGFLKFGDKDAYTVYGAYTALVYMTPFFGGLLADRLLGQRNAVILGGLLMAAGHLVMTVQHQFGFFLALGLLIAGNGFFKPNISTIVGKLYRPGDARRDGGFTIFYMGINLGAGLAPLLCGYIGERYGWHYGFGLATLGMLIGISVFWAPTGLSQVLILGGSIVTAGSMTDLQSDEHWSLLTTYVGLALALVVSGFVAFQALGRGGLPPEVGAPPTPAPGSRQSLFGIPARACVYLGTALAVPLFALLVWGNLKKTVISEAWISDFKSGGALNNLAGTFLQEMSKPAGLVLMVAGIVALCYLLVEASRLEKIPRERLFVILILMFFSMLFWAFFEQAGSSINNFTDRNVDRVLEERVLTQQDVGTTIEIKLSQEQLGFVHDGKVLNMTELTRLKEQQADAIQWKVDSSSVGMGIGGSEVPASLFQAVNPIFILVFGLVLTWLWGFLAARRLEPSTPFKFALGLLQLGLGFMVIWWGAQSCDERGMVAMSWLFLGYLLHTTGELCLSPVGLSMVTKLSPTRLVSSLMGAWFLAMSFSNLLMAVIAQFTGVTEGGDGENVIPIPKETVNVYGDVFFKVGVAALAATAICFVLTPLLSRWMHPEAESSEDKHAGH